MPDTADAISQCYVTIDGAEASAALIGAIVEISVESSLHLPDVATLTVYDPALAWVDGSELEPGKSVTIAIKIGPRQHALFDGEVVEIESDFSGQSHRLLVRAFDRLHRLGRGRKVRSFVQVTDGDLVSTIAGEAGLQAEVGPTPVVHPYLLQHNQTDLAFLQERAAALGYLLYVKGKTLYCRSPQEVGAAVALAWGANLSEFRPRLTTVEQLNDVSVRGWDPKRKSVVIGQASAGAGAPQIGESRKGGAIAQAAFHRQANGLVTNQAIREQSWADRVAKGEADRAATRFVEAEGVCGGEPDVLAGAAVKISGVGNRFSGTYLVTSAHHTYRVDGYSTQFSVSGHHPTTLLGLLSAPRGATPLRGLVVGIVTDNGDPEGQGRVKVKFPWLSDQDQSNWARVVALGAGAERGCEFLPEVNDEVLVGFELGDVNQPYVLGGLWNGVDAPPKKNGQVVTGGKVQQRIIRSRVGHIITLDDSDAGGGVSIVDKNGNKILLDSQQNALTIEVKGNADIKSQGNLTLEAEGNLTLKGQINVDIQAQAQLQAKGAMVKVEGEGVTEIKGAVINLN